MTGSYYYVNGGIIQKSHGDFFFFLDNVADKCASNESMVTGLTYKSVEQKEDLELFRKAKSNKSTTLLEQIEQRMRYKFKINAVDIEKEINLTNNPGLAELMGWTLANYGGSQNKAPIEVINDVVIGTVLYNLLAVDKAHGYNIECTQINETGGEDIITIRKIVSASGSLDGFVSGAKYRFRAQAVLGNDIFSEFTGYVELRIN